MEKAFQNVNIISIIVGSIMFIKAKPPVAFGRAGCHGYDEQYD